MKLSALSATTASALSLTDFADRATVEVSFAQQLTKGWDSAPGKLHDVHGTVATGVVTAFETAQKEMTNARFGLTSFVDRAEAPFGGSHDYCYRSRYPIGDDLSGIADSFDKMIVREGGDAKDCQLSALIGAAVNGGWSDGDVWKLEDNKELEIHRFVVMLTDSLPHEQYDHPTHPLVNPVTAFTYFVHEACEPSDPKCISNYLEAHDYPSVQNVADVFWYRNVTPIFLTTESVAPVYKRLARDLFGVQFTVSEETTSAELADTIYQSILLGLGDDEVIREHCKFRICGCRGASCCHGDSCNQMDDDVAVALADLPKDLVVAFDEEANKSDFLPEDVSNKESLKNVVGKGGVVAEIAGGHVVADAPVDFINFD